MLCSTYTNFHDGVNFRHIPQMKAMWYIDAGIVMDQWIIVEVLDSDNQAYVESVIELALPINQWGETTNDTAGY